jgi:hypothetical protein
MHLGRAGIRETDVDAVRQQSVAEEVGAVHGKTVVMGQGGAM